MASCLKPFTVKQNHIEQIVPCGKCPNCLKRRASAWSFRLMQEDKVSKSSAFITLTYDSKYVPITRVGYMEIRKRDLQLFFKRLRKAQWESGNVDKIKYYAVGEYGGKTMRPHYHIIFFNVDIKFIQDAWQLGNVHYGSISEASVGYTLKYITKPGKVPLHRNDDRIREFSLMSKGLGKSYLTDAMVKWHKDIIEERMYCNLYDGKKVAMPRYYKEKIYSEDERKRISEAVAKKMIDEAYLDYQKSTPEEFVQNIRNRKGAIDAAYSNAKQKNERGQKI